MVPGDPTTIIIFNINSCEQNVISAVLTTMVLWT